MVSLVDKDRMRAKQATIAEILKVWNKANVAVRTTAVTAAAETVAAEALARNEVRLRCLCRVESSLVVNVLAIFVF